MSGELFSAGFAWADAPVSQAPATAAATPGQPIVSPHIAGQPVTAPVAESIFADALDVSQALATLDAIAWGGDHTPAPAAPGKPVAAPVASVAGVAETLGQRLERQLSQPTVAMLATPVATAETANFRGIEGGAQPSVADVASVAGWEHGVATLVEGRVPLGIGRIEWKRLVLDARQVMRLWGRDLHKAGWSVCDVFGVEPNMSHRRVDRLGLVAFVSGGEVEAIDSDTAVTRHGKSRLTFDRRLRGAGSVPLWAVSGGMFV
uniref:hypothetical protein n=1 Tax=uncultured Sphingomonas sp. TaxID=158754 RepID=UPI0035CAD6C8